MKGFPVDVGRLHRVLKIITILQGRRFFNADELAAECSVSRRTIYRDLNMIEAAGIPFYYDRKDGGYQIHQTGLLPPINLNLEEALALVLLASELGKTGRLPFFQPARDAAAKIECTLPLGLRATLGSLVRHMAVRPAATARHNALQEMYYLVQRAIVRGQALDAVYVSFHDAGQIRTRLDPYWLMFHERAWYVIGRSSKHSDIRTFKLGRFKELKATGKTFKRPKGLTLENHLGNAWRMIRGEKTYEVELAFSPLVGPNVAEVNWHKTQRIRWDDDGAVYFTCTVDGLDEIAWWVLCYGPEVEVLKPADLRRRIADMAARMLKLYKAG
jgi:proteasome accessory factor B